MLNQLRSACFPAIDSHRCTDVDGLQPLANCGGKGACQPLAVIRPVGRVEVFTFERAMPFYLVAGTQVTILTEPSFMPAFLTTSTRSAWS